MSGSARRVLAMGLGAGLALALAPWPADVMAADPITLPPDFETRSSASGQYLLELKMRAGGNPHAARATASLWELQAPSRKLLWTRELAHRPRPRFVLVGDAGQVVLLDEWLNLRSELAVMLIDKHNRVVAVHGLEAVRTALDVPIAALAPRARHGAWMQATPVVKAQADAVEVAAADRVLVISLRDGALTRR
jgi:hypothetical protein